MSYSSIAVAAIVVAGLAIGVAVCAAVLLCVGPRRLAERMLPAFLAVLAGGILLSFAAVAGSEDDLQAQAERTVRYATTAERTELARAGHYTTSVTRLAHLSRGLSVELEVDGAQVQATRGPGAGTITLSASLGAGTRAEDALDAAGTVVRVIGHHAARGRSLVQTRARRHTF